MYLDINQLKYVVEIYNTGSITKAAKNLFMGQPNLSKSIKELESEIGITLFSRSSKGVIPTKSGRDFIGYARSILEQMNALSHIYKKDDESEDLYLRIAVPRASYICSAFGDYLNCLDKKNIDIRYRETNALNVINDVSSLVTDLGIIRYQEQHQTYFEKLCKEKSLTTQTLWTYSMVVMMNNQHELSGLSEIPYNLLNDYPQIIHGDLTPISSTEEDSKQKIQNKIAVYDRGSQFDLLSKIKKSYMFASPAPISILSANNLVQKPCNNTTKYCDVLVFHQHTHLSGIESGLVDRIKLQIKEMKELFNI